MFGEVIDHAGTFGCGQKLLRVTDEFRQFGYCDHGLIL